MENNSKKFRLTENPSNRATFICNHLFKEEREILFAAFDVDEAIILACGSDDHEGSSDWHLVGLGHLTSRDPSLATAPELLPGEFCDRKFRGGPWKIGKLEDEE